MAGHKKILFTTENVSWGGSELLWSKTALELMNMGCIVGVCVHPKLPLPPSLLEAEKNGKISVYRLPVQPLSPVKRFSNKLLPYKLRLKPKNFKQEFILRFRPDLLVINQGFNFNGVDTMAFAHQNSLKYVTLSHAVNEALWPHFSLRRKMASGFRNSHQNYFVSQDNLEVTQAQMGGFLSNAKIVRNPFNVPYKPDLAYPKTANYTLACVGRFDFNAKGQDVLLKVLSSDKWKKRNLVVNFYGEGHDTENLNELIEMYGISNAIVHQHTATLDIWKQNQGLILASRYEGLPIVIVEAMLCQRMVIATDVSGNKELLEDNQTGFIAAAPRVDYLDEAMDRAWAQRENWSAMGEKARTEILKQVPENPALVFAVTLLEQLNP